MSFLDDFSTPIHEKKPLFLDDDVPVSDGTVEPSYITSTNDKLEGENSKHECSSNRNPSPSGVPTDIVDKDAYPNGSMISSAEELHFPSSSLYHKKWDLYRSKILGKGSFGCATLYSARNVLLSSKSEENSLSVGGSSSQNYVVVKDVNLQTMTSKSEQMTALRNEVAVLQKIRGHPNVVQLVDYHHDNAGMMGYIITEYCDGGDVATAIEKIQHGQYSPPPSAKGSDQTKILRAFPEEVISSVFIQSLVGLHHLHVEHRILHRDIKPHNIFLLCDGVTVRIGDFGVVAMLDKLGDQAKTICGSPFYMAPEVCAEKPYDGGADIWSLGVLLYEMMAQVRPFIGQSVAALSQLIMKGKCIPLTERAMSSSSEKSVSLPYSKDLMDLVMSMLTVDPKARPTLRRLLRSVYVRKNLNTVPKKVLSSEFYKKLFEENEWTSAVRSCLYEGLDKHTEKQVSIDGLEEETYSDDFENDDEI